VAISPASGLEPLIKFLLMESVLNTLVILPYLKISLDKNAKTQLQVPKPAISFALLLMALIVQWMV
jgi:hypothetical protein